MKHSKYFTNLYIDIVRRQKALGSDAADPSTHRGTQKIVNRAIVENDIELNPRAFRGSRHDIPVANSVFC